MDVGMAGIKKVAKEATANPSIGSRMAACLSYRTGTGHTRPILTTRIMLLRAFRSQFVHDLMVIPNP